MRELNDLAKEIGSYIPPREKKEKPIIVEDPFIEKIKKWLLVGLTSLIVLGAVILIIKSLIGKIF